jgi:hypothetical protein
MFEDENLPKNDCAWLCIIMSGHGCPASYTWCSSGNMSCPYTRADQHTCISFKKSY